VKLRYTVELDIDITRIESASTAAAVYFNALREVLAGDDFRQQGDYEVTDTHVMTD
jgi:hypothetical protein